MFASATSSSSSGARVIHSPRRWDNAGASSASRWVYSTSGCARAVRSASAYLVPLFALPDRTCLSSQVRRVSRHVVERRVPVDLVGRGIEEGVLHVRTAGGDLALWHGPDQHPYATLSVHGERMTHPHLAMR